MATTTFTSNAWKRHSRFLRSALEIAHSAAEQTAELAFHLEAKYDPKFMLPDDLALVYHCVVSDVAVEAHLFLDVGQKPGGLLGVWRPFNGSPQWDGTVKSTIAVLRSDDVSDIVCNVQLAHFISQAAILVGNTSLQGDAA
ncbi:hypothetical protein N2601_08700 [Rhizobium sp. CB3060]|uniref:hypothetical protein n=1 Tax=Rhizobium sp. CB3060 TaxID=3138255 RepID=UPI0021A30BE9|nr:hypothetical protein [Rhizobium tropici]UWU23008.1 hypothetical protein N2601_08700 [Rhizobium tropici]